MSSSTRLLHSLPVFLALVTRGGGNAQRSASAAESAQPERHLAEVAPAANAEESYSAVRTGTLSARREVRIYTQE